MDHKCLGAQNYSTINDLYGTNLNELSAYLTYQVSATGFALGTNGQGVDYQRNSHTVINVNFFSQIDRDTWYYEKNPQNMTDYPKITEKKGEWLTQFAGQASTTPKMFLTRNLDLGNNNKLYGSVQCTRELSIMDCNKCLNESIGSLPKCCDSSKGVRIYSATCDVRLEAFKYF
ncbi:cysteine-rich repeat secretory protein 38 [Quercus suber]|uniref:Cysteine-rich repeat secretory protein 38 n=1 Tax=Quercus suber TaxID=58331 RepID=A0AAW0LTE4_QUESU